VLAAVVVTSETKFSDASLDLGVISFWWLFIDYILSGVSF